MSFYLQLQHAITFMSIKLLVMFLINQSGVWSIKSEKMGKNVSKKPKMTSSNVLFCPQRPKDISFTEEERKQKKNQLESEF